MILTFAQVVVPILTWHLPLRELPIGSVRQVSLEVQILLETGCRCYHFYSLLFVFSFNLVFPVIFISIVH